MRLTNLDKNVDFWIITRQLIFVLIFDAADASYSVNSLFQNSSWHMYGHSFLCRTTFCSMQ